MGIVPIAILASLSLGARQWRSVGLAAPTCSRFLPLFSQPQRDEFPFALNKIKIIYLIILPFLPCEGIRQGKEIRAAATVFYFSP
jgi:hypothetical protein